MTDSTTATETHGGVQDGSQSVVTAVEWGTDGPNTTHKHNRTEITLWPHEKCTGTRSHGSHHVLVWELGK